jgi:GT2 family glycosyltransferase
MKEGSPAVSVVIPTFSKNRTLKAALESVRCQTFKDWEIIVIDDASTDDTLQMLQAFAVKEPRLRVERNKTNQFRVSGITGSLNKGIELARGKYIARLDDDDTWINERKLEKQVAFMDSHPDCVVTGGGTVVMNGDGKELFRYLKREADVDIRKTILFANPFTHTTVMFRKDVAAAVGNYQGMYIEDWDLWLRMGRRGTFYNFQEYFTGYMMTGTNASFRHQRALSRTILKLLWRERKNYPGFAKAYALNLMQYIYALLPFPPAFRVWIHSFLSRLKRKAF